MGKKTKNTKEMGTKPTKKKKQGEVFDVSQFEKKRPGICHPSEKVCGGQ